MRNSARLYRFILIPVGVALVIELISAYIYYQRSYEKGVATSWLVNSAIKQINKYQNVLPPLNATSNSAVTKDEYSQYFKSALQIADTNSTPMIMLYIPRPKSTLHSKRDYFLDLANSQNINVIDMTPVFEQYTHTQLYLLPTDSHLSRFGHSLIAEKVQSYLQSNMPWKKHKQPSFSNTNKIGPHPIGVNQIRSNNHLLAYRVITNSHGFRMRDDITFNNTPQILIVGDSFTFGTNVSNDEAYPNVMNRNLKSVQIINAGFPGAGIEKEIEIIANTFSTIRPSLVILQVLDNDVY